jgi:hypothetical protein
MNISECLLKANELTIAEAEELRKQAKYGLHVSKHDRFRFVLFTRDLLEHYKKISHHEYLFYAAF